MKTLNRSTVTRIAAVRTAKVLGTVNGLGARFDGFRDMRPATALPPGATPSRGYAGCSPSRERLERDCQSHPTAKTWQPTAAAIPANPN